MNAPRYFGVSFMFSEPSTQGRGARNDPEGTVFKQALEGGQGLGTGLCEPTAKRGRSNPGKRESL